jgi:hypothetical protein
VTLRVSFRFDGLAVVYITELTARLLENGGRYQAQYLIPMNLPRLTPDTVDVIFDTYKTDLRLQLTKSGDPAALLSSSTF